MLGKRGQFYLIAAVIIATVLIGIATVSNYVRQTSDSGAAMNNARDSLQVESARTVDYGTNQGFNDTQMKTLLTNFTENYINYTLSGSGYFIFGTQSGIRFIAYQKDSSGGADTITFDYGNGETSLAITQGQIFSQDFTPTGSTVKIKINGFQYSFTLSKAENFYFVLSQKTSGGTYIVTG